MGGDPLDMSDWGIPLLTRFNGTRRSSTRSCPADHEVIQGVSPGPGGRWRAVSWGAEVSQVVEDLQDGSEGPGLGLTAEGAVLAVLIGQLWEPLPRRPSERERERGIGLDTRD